MVLLPASFLLQDLPTRKSKDCANICWNRKNLLFFFMSLQDKYLSWFFLADNLEFFPLLSVSLFRRPACGETES
jgi:hypothetical protein